MRAWCAIVLVVVAACTADDELHRSATENLPREESKPNDPAPTTSSDAAPAANDPPSATDGGANDAEASAPANTVHSHFECKLQGTNAYRPYWMQAIATSNGSLAYKDWSATPKGLLGQNAMTTQAECDQARAAANEEYGVICSRTGLDGWKPTLYTGTVPGRADFGYLGGSSIVAFADCLEATKNSSSAGVCFWGGAAWYVSAIDKESTTKGPFATLGVCVVQTKK